LSGGIPGKEWQQSLFLNGLAGRTEEVVLLLHATTFMRVFKIDLLLDFMCNTICSASASGSGFWKSVADTLYFPLFNIGKYHRASRA
jgi:hypothetical protein